MAWYYWMTHHGDWAIGGQRLDSKKLLFYSTIFQGLNLPSSIISSLLMFLAKCIKHLVLYIMKNIISQCMCDILLNQKVEFYERKHENQSNGWDLPINFDRRWLSVDLAEAITWVLGVGIAQNLYCWKGISM